MSAIKKTNSKKVKVTPLRVVYVNPEYKTHRLLNGLWIVAYSTIWNNRPFTCVETAEFKKLLSEHLKADKNVKQNFKDIVERICLAKRFVSRRKERYIAKPIDWLNINYHNGLAGTAGWLEEVKEQRKTVPHYNEGIATFAHAILHYLESPNMLVFLRYRRMLMEQKQYDLLQIYYNTVLNLQYLF